MENVKLEVENYINLDKEIPYLPSSDHYELIAVARYLTEIIKKDPPPKKLKALKLIRSISEYSPHFLTYLGKHLLHRLHELALFNKEITDPTKGLLLFNSESFHDQKNSAEFLILLLDSLEFWSNLAKTKNKENLFQKTYLELCDSGVVFPISLPNRSEVSKRLEKITDDIRLAKVITLQPDAEKQILGNLKHFKKSIKILIRKSEDLKETFSKEVAIVENAIRKVNDLYKSVQNARFIKGDESDPVPKVQPRCDSPIFLEDNKEKYGTFETDQGNETEWQDIVRDI